MSRKVLKYKSFKELAVAYKKGILVEPITVHEDECFVSLNGVGRVYENDPVWLLKAVLTEMGIPYKN